MDLIDPGFWNHWGEGTAVVLFAILVGFAIFIAYRGRRASVTARAAIASEKRLGAIERLLRQVG
jgi:hypothetical protein